MAFELHPQLAADTIALGDLPHCRVLLMNNCRFPWLILVPRYENLRELFDLPDTVYPTVMEEVRRCAQALAAHAGAHKMNVAALGNMVPQLHVHIIARSADDAAWPNPVWGAPAVPYENTVLPPLLVQLRKRMDLKYK